MTMNKMGYEYVVAHKNAFSQAVADTARANGISADSGNKGHSGTQEREFEQIGLMYLDLVRVCETNNIEEIYEYCLNHDELTNVILTDTMLNVYQTYKESFDEFIKEIRFRVKFAQDLATMYPDKPYNEDEWQKTLADADRWELGGIKEYNPYLDIVLHRNASRLARDCAKAIEKLQRNKEYPLLKKMLMDLVKNGKRWYKTPFGWEPESSLDMLEPEFDMIDMHERVSY